MCKAIEELLADARAEGIAIGEARGIAVGEARGIAKGKAEDIRNIIQFFRQSRMSEKRIISSLAKIFSLKPEEARRFL